MKKELTPEYKRRVQQSINETQRLLDKELSYSKDLQLNDVIERYIFRLAKLNAMLESGFLFDFGGISA